MSTELDLCNRTMQMIGSRSTIASLGEASNESINWNIIFSSARNWCFTVSNWNFARKTAVLTLSKSAPGSPTVWTSSFPAPPWKYQYLYPADAARIFYVISQALNPVGDAWAGKPARFAVTMDTITAVTERVILTDQASAIAIYTMFITDITKWPPYFEQAVISIIAPYLATALNMDKKLVEDLRGIAEHHMTLAVTINRNEGLIFDDTTPEWITARGLVYPDRRPPPQAAAKQEPRDDSRR